MEDKKDGKKKNKTRLDGDAAPEIGISTSNNDVLRAVSSLHDRINTLAFEMTALRGDLAVSTAVKGGKGKRSTGVPDVAPKAALPTAPDALLTALQADADAAQLNTGDAVIVVLTAFAPSPGVMARNDGGEDSDTSDAAEATLQTTVLRLKYDPIRQHILHHEDEAARIERAARIAASLGAPPRVTIARQLLTEGTLTATQIGTGGNMTTGSLYHHLREMTHAGVLSVVSRNLYALTPLGRRVLVSLLAFAQDAP